MVAYILILLRIYSTKIGHIFFGKASMLFHYFGFWDRFTGCMETSIMNTTTTIKNKLFVNFI